jgi:hypothetical protein
MASNSLDLERLEYLVSQAYPAIAPPSSRCHPVSSLMIDGLFKSSSTENLKYAYQWNGKEYTKGGRRTYIFAK